MANGGRPIDDDDFESTCSVGLSTKRPDEGIGNKGVGFKSVLQLCDSPELYSASTSSAGRFDGYRLRFTRDEDFGPIAERFDPDHPGLADELLENCAG